MALCRPNADEHSGEVIGFNFVYSGDFAFKAQVNQFEYLRVVGGINDYDFEWELKKGEKFSTPEAVMVYSDGGIGKMSRIFHDLYRTYLINPRFVDKPRPIVINNWEATYFNFDTKKLCDIIDSVKGTGIDTLVLDDGWFGERNNDKCGLGDWFINYNKLPDGLTPIIDHAHKNGMKFGLWFEPEMISENSDLYRAHPDWAIQVPGIKPCPGRDQLILDLTRDDVVNYVIDVVSGILKTNDIDYVKWDMNRTMTENYSEHLGKNNKEMHHRYILGLYKICEALVNGFPHIFFEGCASGGCRFDPAMLYYFPQIWTSDDTDAYMRTFIQYGTSIVYPLSAMSCHVADCPNHQTGRTTPLASRADIAHLGATGYELDTTKFSDDFREQVKQQVDAYKKMENLVLFGDLYRLDCSQDGNYFAEQIVSKDKTLSHITVMRAMAYPNFTVYRLYLKGLDEKAIYNVEELNLTVSGATLMNVGIIVHFGGGDFITRTFTIKKV
jgi:alpha-galactosidase